MKQPLLIVCCLSLSICQGQELLPRIGYAMNTATFPTAVTEVNTSFTTGFLTGLELQVPITNQFGITSDLLFVQKGYRMDFEFDGTGAPPNYSHLTEKTRVNYADLLALPTYKWSNLYFMLGPGVSYGLFGYTYYATTDTNGQVATSSRKIHFNEDQGTAGDRYLSKRFVLTGVAAVGIEMKERLLLDVRYQISPTQYPNLSGFKFDNDAWYHAIQLTTALRLRTD